MHSELSRSQTSARGASRLDEEEMALLFRTKQKTRKSICELLRQAVYIAYGEVAGKKEGQDGD